MVFIDGMNPHGLWVKSKQPKSNERKNLLGVNTGREETPEFFQRKWHKYRLNDNQARSAGLGGWRRSAST